MRLPTLTMTLLLTGCTLVSDIDGQKCNTDADCDEGRVCSANNFCLLPEEGTLECSASSPCEAGEICLRGMCEDEAVARWQCVDDLPEEPMTGSGQAILRMRVQKRQEGESVPADGTVSVVACEEPSCDQPMGPYPLDSVGSVDIAVPQGFEGFVRLSGEGLVDTLYQLQAPLNVDESAPLEVLLYTEAQLTQLAEGAGVQADTSDLAVVLFQLIDCVGEGSDDVHVEALAAEAAVDVFYLAPNREPQQEATSTSVAGIALATNVPPGSAQFSLVRESTDSLIESLSVETFAATVTYLPYQFGR